MKAEIITIIKPGTMIATIIGNVPGIITCASIRSNRTIYAVSGMFNGEYKEVWLEDFEFVVSAKSEKQKIGFRK